MKINSISNQSFGKLYVSPIYDNSIKKEIAKRKLDVDRIKNSNESHIWVEGNGAVYFKLWDLGAKTSVFPHDVRYDPHFEGDPYSTTNRFVHAVNMVNHFMREPEQ